MKSVTTILREAKGLLDDAYTYVAFHVKDKENGHIAEELCRKIDLLGSEIELFLLDEYLSELDKQTDGN